MINHSREYQGATDALILGGRTHRVLLSFTLIVMALAPSLAQAEQLPESPSSIAQQQARELQELRDRVTALEEQQTSILDDIAQRVVLGGYGALEFESFQGADATFEGKLEVLIAGQIHDRIRFYNEIDLGVPTGTAKAEQSYVDLLIAQWINLRGGVLLVPFGKFNLDHFDPRRDLTDRPLVAQQIVPTTWADLGVSLFGLIPLVPGLHATYEVALVNGLTNTVSPTNGGLRNARSTLGKDNNGDKTVVGRVTIKLLDQYEIGVSGYRGASNPSNGQDITGVGADLEFKPRGIPTLEDFEMKGEFAEFRIEGSSMPSKLYGYYLQLNYHFWPAFLDQTFLGRHFSSPTFTVIGRYDHANISTTAGTGDLSEDRFTLGLNYRPIEDYVIKTEYQINNGGIGRQSWDGFIGSIAWLF